MAHTRAMSIQVVHVRFSGGAVWLLVIAAFAAGYLLGVLHLQEYLQRACPTPAAC